ncbi:MAG: hypothetical protein LBS83_01145 [Holosporales bacterium]|nr:hypothetical protein [Holosporales bacterium]
MREAFFNSVTQFLLQICSSLRYSNPNRVWGKTQISPMSPHVRQSTLRFCASDTPSTLLEEIGYEGRLF